MNGIDKLDQHVNKYRLAHKTVKVYHVTYPFVMDVSLVNEYIAYRMTSLENKVNLQDFHSAVTRGMLQGHSTASYRTLSPTVHDLSHNEEKH